MCSSSSEDEIDENMRESANCDYIQQLFSGRKSASETVSSHTAEKDTVDNRKSAQDAEFENFLAQRLADRIDDRIEFVIKKDGSIKTKDDAGVGIQLLANSCVVRELEETECQEPIRKRVKKPYVNYEARAEEAAVTAEWIKDSKTTKYWKDNKRPRIMEVSVVKHLGNDRMECLCVGEVQKTS